MDQVLVIQVARHVRREGSKHLIDLPGKRQEKKGAWEEFGRLGGGMGSVGMEGGWQRVGRRSYLFLGKPLPLCHQHFFDAAIERVQ